MAKRKNAAALFEVIHTDKRFAPSKPLWTMPSPLAWLRRRDGGDSASGVAPGVSESAPRQPSALWSLIPPMPRMLLDPDRHVVTFKVSYNTAIVAAFAMVAAMALAFVVGRGTSQQRLPALADRTTEDLRSGPAQPDVLEVGPESAPVAMAAQQRPTVRPAPVGAAPPESAPTARRSNEPAPPTTLIDDGPDRKVNMNYVIIQSYPTQELKLAEDAVNLLTRRGVPCTIENGLSWAPSWHVVVGKRGFDRVSSPEYESYVRKIEQAGLEFAGTSKWKRFEPRAFKWQGTPRQPAR